MIPGGWPLSVVIASDREVIKKNFPTRTLEVGVSTLWRFGNVLIPHEEEKHINIAL